MTSTHPSSPATTHDAATARRRHRGAVAARLSRTASSAASSLDWQELGNAPAWLGLGDAACDLFARRVGSVMLAPALRLWIKAPAVAAARAAVGDDWWHALMSHAAWPDVSPELAHSHGLSGEHPDAEELSRLFRDAGTTVLLSTLPHGALRHAASQAMGAPGDTAIAPAQAQAILAITLALLSPRDLAVETVA